MKVVVTKQAQKDLAKLSKDIRLLVYAELYKFAERKVVDLKKLAGKSDKFRIRVGDYRVLISVSKEAITVYALRVLHRRDAYR
ncbi:Cytotoxic translational repressor of toxin-antitoxin stability system [Candidatus Desulfosporosinus infrequens]|uniref:Cytotoxic translational repressor of toxin-antitoxin stability system n=1 Tax=Candidatus Desulfosporosinus infrequens TaxID=2043169 RepID=A0A2U3LJN0_9FIRM|nr:Cytotoxic translational repressor of toxin-antitoxin stability system [Candidatus Desulfosporosinus infrequens]